MSLVFIFMKCEVDNSLCSYSFLFTWLKNLRTGYATENVLLLGDFNSYAFEDPVTYILENGFKSLIDRDASPTPYSYVFDGQWGTLDFAFVLDNSEASDAVAKDWHVNADEIPYLDYNLDYGRDPHIFRASVAARFSDHDPMVIGMNLKKANSISFEQSVCQNFAVHARTTITFGGVASSIFCGDVGVSPGTSITGSYQFLYGGRQVVDSSDDFAASVLISYNAAMEVRSDGQAMAIEIGGKTFTPGTYRSGSAINIAFGTVVTLDGLGQDNPMFLFQAGSTLVTAANTYFILKNGAKAENVLWALGTAATLGDGSILEGSIVAGTAITFGTKSTLRGCALAQSAVTFESEGSIELNHEDSYTIAEAGPSRRLRGPAE
jgi:hypothetical protein